MIMTMEISFSSDNVGHTRGKFLCRGLCDVWHIACIKKTTNQMKRQTTSRWTELECPGCSGFKAL